MRRIIVAIVLVSVALAGLPASAQRAEDEGIKLRRPAFTRYLVSASRLERAAGLQYSQMREQAARKGSLAPADDPQTKRVQRIAQELLQHAGKWNTRANDWKWEVSLVRSRTVQRGMPARWQDHHLQRLARRVGAHR